MSVSDIESTTPTAMETCLSLAKDMEAAELFKMMKALVTEAEKRTKNSNKTTKKAVSSKKGQSPPQLIKPRAWVSWTLADAMANGWESFTIVSKKQGEEIVMAESMLNSKGQYVYSDSVTDGAPDGKVLTPKDAMSLSKQRKTTGHPSWAKFEASYTQPEIEDSASETSSVKSGSTGTSLVRKTAAEKAAEKEKAKAEKDAEKAAQKAAKDAEKAAQKAEKDAEKAAQKASKDAEKEKAKAEKEAAKAVKKSPKAAAAAPKATPAPIALPTKAAAPTAIAKPVKKAAAAPKEDVVIPDDGNAHPWTWKNKKYCRTSMNEIWEMDATGGCGKWCGIYSPVEDKIDDSVPEPEFEDEE